MKKIGQNIDLLTNHNIYWQLLFSKYCSILVLSCSLSLWWWVVVVVVGGGGGGFLVITVSHPTSSCCGFGSG